MGEVKQFYYAKSENPVVSIARNDLVLPIVWNKNGLYGMITVAKIQNELDVQKTDLIVFNWHETGILPFYIVRWFLDGQE